jgi:hypothetical protein
VETRFGREADVGLAGERCTCGACSATGECPNGCAFAAACESADDCTKGCAAARSNRGALAATLAVIFKLASLNRVWVAVKANRVESQREYGTALHFAGGLRGDDGAGDASVCGKNEISADGDGRGENRSEPIAVIRRLRVDRIVESDGELRASGNRDRWRRRWRRWRGWRRRGLIGGRAGR